MTIKMHKKNGGRRRLAFFTKYVPYELIPVSYNQIVNHLKLKTYTHINQVSV